MVLAWTSCARRPPAQADEQSTTLETLGHDVSGPMWGSEILVDRPEVIADVHERWVEAGAELLGTATAAGFNDSMSLKSLTGIQLHGLIHSYQMTLSGLQATKNPEQAGDVMARAISLAHSACRPSNPVAVAGMDSESPGVVLSLGPFGAHLKPSQEYAGVYPPPYGPIVAPASPSSASSSTTTNHFSSSLQARQAQDRAEAELAAWHLARLRAFANSPDSAWDQLEWVAFETVPLFTEIRAARRAMAVLNRELPEDRRKQFWVCSAFPEGRHPQTKSDADGKDEHEGMEGFVTSALGALERLDIGEEREGDESGLKMLEEVARLDGNEIPPADAIGINCTSPAYLPSLTTDLTVAVASLSRAYPDKLQPILVLYPDGGAVYDTTTRKWTNRVSGAEDWARDVSAVARTAFEATISADASQQHTCEDRHVWGGVIVGGCCKAGFDEIRLLKKELR